MGFEYLITGGQGFFGAWIARRLLEEEASFVLTDLQPDDRVLRQVLSEEEIGSLNIRFGDISSGEFVQELVEEVRPARIIHLAGLQVPACRSDPVLGAKVNVTKRTATRTLLVVKLKEGRHREVRRVCARLGHKVRRLVRTHVGTVALGSLAVGQVRPLSSTEIKNLRSSARTVIRLGTTPKAMVVSRAQRRHRGGPGRRRGPGQRKKKGGTPRQSQRKG